MSRIRSSLPSKPNFAAVEAGREAQICHVERARRCRRLKNRRQQHVLEVLRHYNKNVNKALASYGSRYYL
jgi:hypothetical protein